MRAGSPASVEITIRDVTTRTLVSNLAQPEASEAGTASSTFAQEFTTGSAPEGYTLSSIEARMNVSPNAAQRATIRAELWSGATGSGPGAKVASLAVPVSIPAKTVVSFTAPAGTALMPSTPYYFVVYTLGGFSMRVGNTQSDSEDSGGQPGWSIGDTVYLPLSGYAGHRELLYRSRRRRRLAAHRGHRPGGITAS